MSHIHLSTYDAANPAVKLGDRVRLRPAADWRTRDDGERPIHCLYTIDDGLIAHEVGISWSADLDDAAGREFSIVGQLHNPHLDRIGLPRINVLLADGTVGNYIVHPDWLTVVAAHDPLGPECSCDALTTLMHVGCKCGRWKRERAAR